MLGPSCTLAPDLRKPKPPPPPYTGLPERRLSSAGFVIITLEVPAPLALCNTAYQEQGKIGVHHGCTSLNSPALSIAPPRVLAGCFYFRKAPSPWGNTHAEIRERPPRKPCYRRLLSSAGFSRVGCFMEASPLRGYPSSRKSGKDVAAWPIPESRRGISRDPFSRPVTNVPRWKGAGFPHLAWHSRSESGDCQRGARRIGTGSCRSRVVTRESSCPALVFSSRRDELEREKQGRREGGRGKRKRGNAGRPVSGFRALLQIGMIIDKASVLRK